MTRLPLTQPEMTRGLRGARVTLRDKSGAVTVTLTFDTTTRRFQLDWRYQQPDEFSPLDLLPAAMFAAAIEQGAQVETILNRNNLEPDNQTPLQTETESDGDATQFARFLEHLVNVQIKTRTFFDVRNEVTAEEARDVETASRLLNGASVEATWPEVRLLIRPGGREPVTAAFGEPPGANQLRIGYDFTITVQEVDIRIGQVTRILESAQVHSWEEPPDGEPSGSTTLVLVPAETNRVTMQLDAGDGTGELSAVSDD